MALFKTSLQLDTKVTAECKKIAFANNRSFNKLVRDLMAECVRKHKRAVRARLNRAARKTSGKPRP